MHSLVERVEAYVDKHQLLRKGELVVVVGLSGGADSVVLAHVLMALNFPIFAVHVNYGLRGKASEEDETFVRAWCEERNVDLQIFAFPVEQVASERGQSIQHAARDLRYDAFYRAAREVGAASVAVGHHRDDQAETVLLNLFRGTGLEGLAGMPPKRRLVGSEPASGPEIGGEGSKDRQGSPDPHRATDPNGSKDPKGSERTAGEPHVALIRPLLGCSREDIESYARSVDLVWRDDLTNTSSAYRRGALRSEILPSVERHFGTAVIDRVARSAELVRAYLEASLEPELRAAFDAAAEAAAAGGALRLDELNRMPPVIRRRIVIESLRRWLPEVEASSTAAEAIDSLRDSQVGRKLEYGGNEIWRERNRLLFVPRASAGEGVAERRESTKPLEPASEAHMGRGTIRAETVRCPPRQLTAASPNEAYLDARAVRFPLHVRPWKSGDRFSPLGMTHRKKLSDFLTDDRVPPHRRKEVYVVLSDDEIVWVVGHRIAHPARVREDTTETVRLSYHPAEN